jgi:hypothetical protein
MLIGDSVTYDGRTYVVVGFTPAGVKPAQIESVSYKQLKLPTKPYGFI